MNCLLVLSALVFALVSARPEGFSYYTPHGSSSGHGGSATSSASLHFTSGSAVSGSGVSGSGVSGAALSGGASELDDCEEPTHGHLNPYQHSQVHYFAPHVSTGHSGSSSSSSSSSSASSLYLGGSSSSGHQQQQHSLPSVHAHVAESSSSGSGGYHYQPQHHHQTEQKVVTQQVHHHVEPQIEYFTDVHQHQGQQSHQQHHHAVHHHAPTVHYVQQPLVKEEVHKHVYVHVAPEEKEEIHQKVILPTYTKQKHYKIIFIKAPSPPAVSKVVLPQQPVNEEKTLVYVLHQKPELEQEIVVPAPATAKPSKPEVYFIKYKTKKEEQHHHHQQQQQQHSYQHHEEHKSSGASFGSSTASSISGGGFEAADLSGFAGSFGLAPIVVTEGSYHHHHSTTPAPVKVTTVHSVLSSSAAPSPYVSSTAHSTGHKASQSINVSNVGLSGYATGGSRQRGSKKSCGKCSKTSSTPLSVGEGSLDAFVSNVF